MWFVIEIL